MPRQRIASAFFSSTPDEQIQEFALEGLFPPNHLFVLNGTLGTLLHLSVEPDTPHPLLIGEQQFTERELDIVLPLLTNYPAYAPMKVLYASFYGGFGHLNERAITRARERLHEVLEERAWDQEIRPIRNVMSRVRFKLRQVGLDTVSMLETGYMLIGNTRSGRL